MGKLKLLIIHCTATPENMPVTFKMIRAWHTDPPPTGRGWKQVGYSDMIHLTGIVENLVPYNEDDIIDAWEVTNGVEGINHMARHLVYVGGMDGHNKTAKDTRNSHQLLAMKNYITTTIAHHPEIKIGGHNQFNKDKACPSFDVPRWLKSIGVKEENIYKC